MARPAGPSVVEPGTVGSENLHEPADKLRPETIELHRAIVSLMEELEAVDWYQQRADATSDEALRAVLLHNRDEEIEHAMMNLEWIRRHEPVFDHNARTYLFKTEPITEIEEAVEGGGEAAEPAVGAAPRSAFGGSLGIGSLRGR